jgi:hypothetical protein
MDIEDRGGLELWFVLPRMNAIDGANVHAGSVLGSNARVGDDERHSVSLHKKRPVWE